MMRVLLFLLAVLGTRAFADGSSAIEHSRSPDDRYDIGMSVTPNDPDGSAGHIAIRNRGSGKLEPGSSEELIDAGLANLGSDSILWSPDSRAVAINIMTGKAESSCYLLARGKGGWLDLSEVLEKEVNSIAAAYRTKDWNSRSHDHLGAIKWVQQDTLELEWAGDYYRSRPDGSVEVASDRLLYFAVRFDGVQPVAHLSRKNPISFTQSRYIQLDFTVM